MSSAEMEASVSESARFAKSYEFVPDRLPTIDGELLPWWISEVGPLVEAIDGVPMHILWLPIMVDAPMPTPPEGAPDGQPLPD